MFLVISTLWKKLVVMDTLGRVGEVINDVGSRTWILYARKEWIVIGHQATSERTSPWN